MRGKFRVALFGLTALGASGLLFAVQPMAGKMLLPAFGGTAGVWGACLLFFQVALLVGYGYAHVSTRYLMVREQAMLHALLATTAIWGARPGAMLALAPPTSGAWGPGLWAFAALATTIGPGFVVLSATSPLLQRWYSRDGRDPFILYAVSCAGNLAALAAYPLVIEPSTTLGSQKDAWTLGVSLAALATVLCAVASSRRGEDRPEPAAVPVPFRDLLAWAGLACGPVVWLLALTAHITSELAPMPLLWTIPLGLYLVTYILAFAGAGERWTAWLAPAFPWLATALALVLAAGFAHLAWIPLHLAAFFVASLAAHHRLARRRPDPSRLTTFYLAIGAGGALGSLFVAIVAPWAFDRMVEYPLILFAACLATAVGVGFARGDLAIPAAVLATGLALTHAPGLRDSGFGAILLTLGAGLGVLAAWRAKSRPWRFALAIGAVLAVGGLAPDPGGEVVLRSRNFFGPLRVLVDREEGVRRLMHGRTLHGQQSLDPAPREEPSTYFARSGPVGDLFAAMDLGPNARAAVVGLGTGTLACYARPGQRWTFHEIDAAVVQVAEDERFFTYLADARRRGVEVAVVEGDARLRLAEAPDGKLDAIILDAFSSDAVPVHLLSREAIALYRRKLAPGGVLAFNLSSKFLDLPPLIARQAADAGLPCRVRWDLSVPEPDLRAGRRPSIWAVLADLPDLPPTWLAPSPLPGASPWTDDYSDLVSYLILARRPSVSSLGVEPAIVEK
jgi:SAM-dependent methyltransferase